MSCCSPAGYSAMFGPDLAAKDALRYRRKGLTATSARWIRDRLTAGGVEGRTVLEVGGGVGALQIELLEAGAAASTNVELVDSYEQPAAELLAERALGDRVDRQIADFAQEHARVPAADIVVLHRVLCCYPDADLMTSAACDHARERVAITIPRESWWTRGALATLNAWMRLRRIGFRAYVHPPGRIEGVAHRHGFRIDNRSRGVFWESTVLRRGGAER